MILNKEFISVKNLKINSYKKIKKYKRLKNNR